MIRLVDLSQKKILENQSGDCFCLDATAGNGWDTLFLAKLSGASGLVYSFDLQHDALKKTKELLVQNSLEKKVELIRSCHSNFDLHVPLEMKRKFQAITFNLGYLPGSDKKVVTQKNTTLSAIEKAYDWLKESGIISVISYVGQPGGLEESKGVSNLVGRKNWRAERFTGNTAAHSPTLYLIRKVNKGW